MSKPYARPCEVYGCYQPRVALSRFCYQHRHRAAFWGHPQARLVRTAEIGGWMRHMADFLRHHADQKPVEAAVEWLDDLLSAAARSSNPTPLETHLARLHAKGLRGPEALAWLAAVVLWSRENRNRDDVRLSFLLARGLLFSRPLSLLYDTGKYRRYVRPTTSIIATLGHLLREVMGVFLARLLDFYDREKGRERDRRVAINSSFSSTTEGPTSVTS